MFLGIWHPIIKKLWTSSFVLASSGVCFLLLSLFYWIIDVNGKVKWAFPLKVIGMNAIVAYMLSHVFNFHLIAEMVLYGLKQFVGDFNYLVLTIGGFGILYLILWYMFKNKTFIKV
jgi:predicted acyltransferase